MIERSFILLFFHSIFQITCQYFFQCALTFTIEKKIVLASDVCSRPHITIRSHNLHASDIRRVVGEIISYHERD